jgi:hypothetical protein
MLHLVIPLKEYCHALNFDTGRGEQLLKVFFKDLAKKTANSEGKQCLQSSW